MATPVKFVQTPAVALYASMAAADTTMRITPNPVDLNGTKLTITDFGTTGYCTVDPKISGYEEIVSFTGVTDNGDGTATLTGLTRNLVSKSPYTTPGTGKQHGASAVVVFSDNPQVYAQFGALANDNTWTGQQTFSVFPITPATPLATVAVYGFVRLSVAPASAADPVAVGANDTTTFAPLASAVPVASISPYMGLTVPSGWLTCDGSTVSRTTYATLFAALTKNATMTVTIASPAVISSTGHGLVAGNRVQFTTTGALPTGLVANTNYYVISAGLTANAFEVAATPGGAAINTSGSQNGTHKFWYGLVGFGDGSTTFVLPDLRGRVAIGSGTGTKMANITTVAGNVITSADLSNAANNEFQTGQAIVFTATVAGNLVNATTYYVVRTGNNTFSLATTLVNAQAGTLITLAGTETGSFLLTLTARVAGDTGGEENHAMSVTELLAHTHPLTNVVVNGTSGISLSGSSNSYNTTSATGSTGGNAAMNDMQPFLVVTYIIKT